MEIKLEKQSQEVFFNMLRQIGAFLDGPTEPIAESPPAGSPLVSVIIPVFNRKSFIEPAIASVLSGTYDDFEIIVIDNGSTDGTIERVESYVQQDHRIHLIKNKKNVIAYSLNLGLKAARGKYIAQLDSDDEYTKETLAEMVGYLETHPHCALAISYYEMKIPEDYRNWIKEKTFALGIEPLSSIGTAVTIPLPEVYIPIKTRSPSPAIKNQELSHTPGENFPGYPTIDIETLGAKQNCLLLCGEPGMGKTTLVKHLAFTVGTGSCQPVLKEYLPFIVSLKSLWPILLRENPNIYGKSTRITLEQILNIYLKEIRCPLAVETILHFLSQGKVLFLFDGLDEIPGHIQPGLIDILAAFQQENSSNRFLFTGRPQGITGQAMKWFGDYLQTIEYLDTPMIENFIFNWFGAVSTQAPLFKNISPQELLSNIMRNVPAMVLTQVPSLLTAVCILYQYVKCARGKDLDITDYIIKKLTRMGLLSYAESIKSNALFDYLLFIYAQTHRKNTETFANYNLHDLLKGFFSN